MSLDSFEPMTLFVSLVTSLAGFGLFSYGRKQQRLPQVAGGLLLMVYPYFVSSLSTMLIAGSLICAGVWLAVRAGW
ncbi:MAG: hypothetical protein ABIP90_07190 [Vicinamibacterales bacterium]